MNSVYRVTQVIESEEYNNTMTVIAENMRSALIKFLKSEQLYNTQELTTFTVELITPQEDIIQ